MSPSIKVVAAWLDISVRAKYYENWFKIYWGICEIHSPCMVHVYEFNVNIVWRFAFEYVTMNMYEADRLIILMVRLFWIHVEGVKT